MEQPDPERLLLEAYQSGRKSVIDSLPPSREAMACAIDALIVDDPRSFNAWMTQGVVLLKQQADETKAARRPRGVVVEDGIDNDMQSSGISSESGFAGDGPARWAQKVAERQGMARETAPAPAQYAPPQASYDPNLASLVRAAVQEYMHGVSGTQLASPPPLAGYGYAQPVPVAPPLPFPSRAPQFPSLWYDPRRR